MRAVNRWYIAPRIIVSFVATALTLGWSLAPGNCAPVEAAIDHSKQLSVDREDGHSFKLVRLGSPTVRVTFLAAETFRIHMLSGDEEDAKLPEYMVVKSDRAYPAVDVHVEAHQDGVTFRTTAAALRLVVHDESISVDVRTPTRVLIENWKIYACCRTARLDLRSDEHI
jgi:hypothetical protein